MYAKQYKSNIIELSIPPQPLVNSTIQYMRCGRLITGKLLGTHGYQVQRYSAVVCEYIIAPDRGHSNLSFHVVQEDDIVWGREIKPPCPDCNDHGIIALNGDNDVPCKRCGFVDADEVF